MLGPPDRRRHLSNSSWQRRKVSGRVLCKSGSTSSAIHRAKKLQPRWRQYSRARGRQQRAKSSSTAAVRLKGRLMMSLSPVHRTRAQVRKKWHAHVRDYISTAMRHGQLCHHICTHICTRACCLRVCVCMVCMYVWVYIRVHVCMLCVDSNTAAAQNYLT